LKSHSGQARGAIVLAILFFGAPVAWIGFQQGMGAVSYLNCGLAGSAWGLLVGLSTISACAAIAIRCWIVRGRRGDTSRFLMTVGAGFASIFALAALIMTVALAVVPACAR
jgi:hypothetical protein